MNVSLTPHLEALIKQKVASGLYNSSSEVMREALRLLEERDRKREIKLEALREAVQKGIAELDAGLGLEWDKEEFLKEAQARFAARTQAEQD